MGRVLLERRPNGKLISALNSNNHYKRPKETHRAALEINCTDTILAWARELFHGTSVLSQLEFYVAQLTLARHRNLAQYFHAVAKIKVCCIKNYCQSLPYPSFSLTNLNLENDLTAKFLLLQFRSILILLAPKNYKIFGWNKLNKDKRRTKKKKKK